MADTISTLEYKVQANAESALSSLEKLEEKLNSVADILSNIQKSGNAFSGIAKAAQYLDRLSKSSSRANKNKRDLAKNTPVNIDTAALERTSALLDEIKSKMRLSDFFGKKNPFGALSGGTQLPAIRKTYYDYMKMLPALYKPMGSNLPATTQPMGSNLPATTKAFGTQLPEIPSYIEAIEVEWREVSEAAKEASDAIEDVSEEIENLSNGEGFVGLKNTMTLLRNVFFDLKDRISGNGSRGSIFDGIISDPQKPQASSGLDLSLHGDVYDNVEEEVAALTPGAEDAADALDGIGDAASRSGRRVKSFSQAAVSAITRLLNITKKVFGGVVKVGSAFGSLAKKIATPMKQIKAFGSALQSVFGKGSSGGGLLGRRSLGQFIGLIAFRRLITSAIRALVSGIKEGSDNLVQYSKQYNAAISSMTSSLLFLKNAWAAAFAPVVEYVAPILSAFVDMIASALNAVGRFMAALTGKGFAVQAVKVFSDYAKGLDSTGSAASGAKKALDEYKRTILSFDELHVLNDVDDDTASGGGGGGGGNGNAVDVSKMFTTVPLGDEVSSFGSRLRELIKQENWSGVGDAVAQKIADALGNIQWTTIQDKAKEVAHRVAQTINGFVSNKDVWKSAGETIGNAINTATGTALTYLNETDFVAIGAALAKMITSAIEKTNWSQLGQVIGAKFMVVWDVLYGLVTDGSLWTKVGDALYKTINGLFDRINLETIGKTLAAIFNGIRDILIKLATNIEWNSIASKMASGFNAFIGSWDAAGLGQAANSFIGKFISALLTFVQKTNWAALGQKIGAVLSNINWTQHLTRLAQIIVNVLGQLLVGFIKTDAGRFVTVVVGIFTALKWATHLSGLVNTIASVFGGSSFSTAVGSQMTTGIGKAASSTAKAISAGGGIAVLGTSLAAASGIAAVGIWSAKLLELVGDYHTYRTGSEAELDALEKKYYKVSQTHSMYSDEQRLAMQLLGDQFRTTANTASSSTASISASGRGLKDAITQMTNTIKANVASATTSVSTSSKAMAESIPKNFQNQSGNLKNAVQKLTNDITDTIHRGQQVVRTSAFNLAKESLSGFSSGVTTAQTGILNSLTSFTNIVTNRIKSIKLPKIKTTVSSDTHYVSGQSFNVPRVSYAWYYAKGGFPQNGEAFIANENGIEMMGRMGSRNVVANNAQIVNGIKQGVYQAMIMANGGSSDDKSIPYMFDITVRTQNDEVLARAVERGQAQRGYRYKTLATE